MVDFVLVGPHKNCTNNDFFPKYGNFIKKKGIKVKVKVKYLFNNRAFNHHKQHIERTVEFQRVYRIPNKLLHCRHNVF